MEGSGYRRGTPALHITGGVNHANANRGNGNATSTQSGHELIALEAHAAGYRLANVRNGSTSNLRMNSGLCGAINSNAMSSGAANTNPNYGKRQHGVILGLAHQFLKAARGAGMNPCSEPDRGSHRGNSNLTVLDAAFRTAQCLRYVVSVSWFTAS